MIDESCTSSSIVETVKRAPWSVAVLSRNHADADIRCWNNMLRFFLFLKRGDNRICSYVYLSREFPGGQEQNEAGAEMVGETVLSHFQ